MNVESKQIRLFNWKITAIAFAAAPLSVLLHELAHVGALEFGGVDAHLRGFSMGMPVGFFWDFEGLEKAAKYFNVTGSVFAGRTVTIQVFDETGPGGDLNSDIRAGSR